MNPELKPLIWIGGSRKAYAGFPEEVQDNFGYALYLAQAGEREIPGAKLLGSGILKGRGIVELVEDFDGDTFRAVYTARLGNAIYVLHAFKKKSRRGIATPQHEIELICDRYDTAVRIHQKEFGESGTPLPESARDVRG